MRRPAVLLVALSAVLAGGAATARAETGHPFFALCHDTHDAKKRTLPEQAEMLAALGYDGVAHLWLGGLAERLQTLDAKGLKLYQVYVRVSIDPAKPKFDPKLPEAIKLLKDRPTTLGLLVSGAKPSDAAADQRAVPILREIADLAAASGIRVALYPHTGDWIAKTSDAVRVVKKVDRNNFGAMFNLCHWLKVEGPENLEPMLKEAAPHLFVVTINGADPPPGGWDRLIQPLGSGAYDVGRVLQLLDKQGYAGPVGLQCYGIGGDAQDHLKQSIAAWKKLSPQAAPSQK